METFIPDLLLYIKIAVIIILTFGLAVFVHEFGHMFFALVRGVGVESFAIGMGPKICDWKWGGIEFSLRWLPIGGFVKLRGMVAEDEETAAGAATQGEPGAETRAAVEESPATGLATARDVQVDTGKEEEGKTLAESSYDDMQALSNKGLVTKLMVFGGGVFMNYLAAIFALFVWGMLDKQVKVYDFVLEDAVGVAKEYGFQANDRIVAVDGTPVQYEYDYHKLLSEKYGETLSRAEGTLAAQTFTVERDGQRVEIAVPAMDKQAFGQFSNDQVVAMPAIVGDVTMTYPAEKAGVKAGDRVVEINGVPIQTWKEMVAEVEPSVDRELTMKVERGTETLDFKMMPVARIDDATKGQIGIGVGGPSAVLTIPGDSFTTALVNAPGETWFRMKYLVEAQVDFFRRATFKQITENVGGPVSIGRLTGKFAAMGLPESIAWFATLNLLLMIFNLLPIPVLDGGFILLSFIEAIIRRPVPAKVLDPIFKTFFLLFVGLMLTITFWDVKRWLF